MEGRERVCVHVCLCACVCACALVCALVFVCVSMCVFVCASGLGFVVRNERVAVHPVCLPVSCSTEWVLAA